jgi:hypothetical protein
MDRRPAGRARYGSVRKNQRARHACLLLNAQAILEGVLTPEQVAELKAMRSVHVGMSAMLDSVRRREGVLTAAERKLFREPPRPPFSHTTQISRYIASHDTPVPHRSAPPRYSLLRAPGIPTVARLHAPRVTFAPRSAHISRGPHRAGTSCHLRSREDLDVGTALCRALRERCVHND